MKIKHNCKEELKELDLKATPARLAVMTLLESSDKPIDVLSIIDYLKIKDVKTDPATVFRIVNMFAEKGLVKPIQLHEGKFRYELSSKAEHHHLICNNCGNIEDISDCAIYELESDIQKKKGFLVKHHSLEFFGVCKQCQR